jgi:DNA-binding response OmpR family regulator
MDKKKILIVDDDPDVRQGMYVRLKANDYDIVFATDAISSIAEAREQNPDLILLDLGLPGGDGFVVMDRLKMIPSTAVIPIIVVSARTGLANQQRALKAGVKAFLEKPVDNAELLAVIRQALGEPSKVTKSTVYDIGNL